MDSPPSSLPGRVRWKQRLSLVGRTTQQGEIDVTRSVKRFCYSALGGFAYEIRVLKLQKGCNLAALDKPLRFGMTRIRPPDARDDGLDRMLKKLKPYYAISYTWGENPRPTLLILDGKEATVPSRAVEAPRGLLSAMHLAGFKQTEYVWIDAICVDQSDQMEKSQQVTMMRKVYSQAKG